MSSKDDTIDEPKAHESASRPLPLTTKSDTHLEDMTEELGGMKLADHDKTPTQSTDKVTLGQYESKVAASPIPVSATLAVPGSGLMRKSASSITLRASDADDVFAPSTETVEPQQEASSATVEPVTVSDRIRAGCLSIVPPNTYAAYQPRPDRGTEVNIHNAQGMWPADAVVFVANLSAARTTDQLEYACHQIFDVFGRNIIKVKYDKNKHPFALVQYETPESALEAIASNHGAVLDGRIVRLEQGKAERAVILTKNNGSPFGEGEARAVLEPFGAIDALYPTYALRGRMSTLPGFFVRFAFYQDCRDALKALSGLDTPFRLQLSAGSEQDNGQAVVSGPFIPRQPIVPQQPVHTNSDSKSVFVGNLPIGITKQDLVDIFAGHGQIIDVNVITKRYEGGSINVFGFVEYANGEEADDAAYQEKWIAGKKLRIEPKEYTARRGTRINQGIAANPPMVSTPARSPRRTPRRLTPQANNALTSRLAANNVENFGSIYTPGPTPPQHLLPAHLFSPSPEYVYPMGGGHQGYGGPYYDQYGNTGGYGGPGGM